ncbi:hypothetical protein EV379_2980 [Microterricola gilva]|uniref:Uncharacterized protein n=1 Tax=Microterricola gilva TaxID=393267 RepID=A0A4Q8APQ5_9MICO|nr:hypothetical protein [Microterricola gilva]RZU66617.1 hypothetical protein EV379_2980 [Microterricola gilva]
MSTPDNSPIAPEIAATTPPPAAEDVAAPVADDAWLTVPLDGANSGADTPPKVGSVGPRTRWAAIVWGLVFAALASGALYVVLSPQHRIELIDWVTSLEPTTLALYGALAIGVIVLLFGLVGLLRRAQRALAARRASA